MRIDDTLILDYLSGKPVESYSNHWVFHSINEGQILFQPPSAELIPAVAELQQRFQRLLSTFIPWNQTLIAELWPDFGRIEAQADLLLSVGCPNPYDAMIRNHQGKEYIIIDLIRFLGYGKSGSELEALISKFLTHELVHVCLHKDFPPIEGNYLQQLDYLIFNEGLAHLLAYQPDILNDSFDGALQQHYASARLRLREALQEHDFIRQKELLREASSGSYWQKFGAIAGKLYLHKRKGELKTIYKQGWQGFAGRILADE